MVNWQPGDPLYRQGGYTNYLFNFRYEAEQDDVECRCPDRASWPEPHKGSGHRLPDGDELDRFIDEYRNWQSCA